MKYVVCSFRDRAAVAYGRPIFVAAVGQAVRSFADEINRAADDNPLYKHPEDFDLYELGTFDDDSGLFETGVPRQVAVGKDLVQRVEEPQKLRAVN